MLAGLSLSVQTTVLTHIGFWEHELRDWETFEGISGLTSSVEVWLLAELLLIGWHSGMFIKVNQSPIGLFS